MKIYFINGLLEGEQIELFGSEISIGRETDNNIVIESDSLSRHHAKLIKQPDENWLLKDLGSTNGCKVNKELIKDDKLLVEGDVITLGDQEFRLGEEKNKALPSDIPIIKSIKKTEDSVAPINKTFVPEKKAESLTVNKIIFEPIPKKTEDNPEKNEKTSFSKPIIETVKSEVVAEKAKSQASSEDEKSPLLTAKELSESANDIFDAKGKAAAKESVPIVKKHFLNILFYLILLMAVVVFVFWFLSYNKSTKKSHAVSVVKDIKIPLVLHYVKNKITKDNVFRFSLLVENNIAKFTIDDLKSDRHYSKTIKDIKPEFMKALKSAIEDTGFMELQPVSQGSTANNLDETRKMTIALNNKFNSITIQNNSAPTSFEDIEAAIEEFADGYDLLTFAMPPKELQKRATESFTKAEEYYANRSARAGNLLEAERRYKITIDYLNQFSPKPKIWDIARKRYDEVRIMRKKRWNELQYEVERLERLNKIKEAIEVLNEMIQLAPEGSKAYKRARVKITRLSEALRKRKK